MRIPRSRTLAVALLVVSALFAAACGDDGGTDEAAPDDAPETGEDAETTTTAPTTTAPIPEEGDALVDLVVTAVTFGDAGTVTIQNRGADDADVNGIFFCQRPNYRPLEEVVDGGVIPAGGSVEIPAAEIGGLAEAGGEAALYNGNDFESADSILAYVQWGTGGGRASVAVEAGIWPADGSVTPDPTVGGIELFGDPADPASWG